MTDYVDMVDTIHADVDNIPADFPKVCGYTTGTPDIQWTAQDWARFRHSAKIRLNQQDGSDPFNCDGFDIEPGAWQIPNAVSGASRRRALRTVFYLPASMLPEAEAAVRAAGLTEWVYYGIANWNLSHEEAVTFLGGRVVWVQWASPTSNPDTLIPGTKLTLAEANADLSVTVPWWHPVPHRSVVHRIIHGRHPAVHHPRPVKHRTVAPHHRKVIGAGGGVGGGTGLVAILTAVGVHLTPTEAAGIVSLLSLLVTFLTPPVR